ncbi:MAG TPA: membrane protein insertion efficiency factor YidD [Rectinemataceae bacterium]
MSFLKKVVSAPFLLLIKVYRVFVSPLFPPSCRFYPTCSAYSYEAISKYGPVKGGWLAMKRISRCHPRNPGGFDPVP